MAVLRMLDEAGSRGPAAPGPEDQDGQHWPNQPRAQGVFLGLSVCEEFPHPGGHSSGLEFEIGEVLREFHPKFRQSSSEIQKSRNSLRKPSESELCKFLI